MTIIDDSLFEEEEEFLVVLTEPMGGRVGEKSDATVIIEPDKTDGECVCLSVCVCLFFLPV